MRTDRMEMETEWLTVRVTEARVKRRGAGVAKRTLATRLCPFWHATLRIVFPNVSRTLTGTPVSSNRSTYKQYTHDEPRNADGRFHPLCTAHLVDAIVACVAKNIFNVRFAHASVVGRPGGRPPSLMHSLVDPLGIGMILRVLRMVMRCVPVLIKSLITIIGAPAIVRLALGDMSVVMVRHSSTIVARVDHAVTMLVILSRSHRSSMRRGRIRLLHRRLAVRPGRWRSSILLCPAVTS